jgi:hypothetical protein
MHEETKRIMRRVRRKLTQLIYLEAIHCGHEEGLEKAMECRFELEEMIKREIEKIIERGAAL